MFKRQRYSILHIPTQSYYTGYTISYPVSDPRDHCDYPAFTFNLAKNEYVPISYYNILAAEDELGLILKSPYIKVGFDTYDTGNIDCYLIIDSKPN